MFGSGRAEQAYLRCSEGGDGLLPILLAFSVYNPYNGGLLILLAFFLYYWVPTIGLVAFSLYCMLAFSLYCWPSPYIVGFVPILLAFSLYCMLAFSLYCWPSSYTVGFLPILLAFSRAILLAFSLYCWPSPCTVGLLPILLAFCWPSPYTVGRACRARWNMQNTKVCILHCMHMYMY